MKRKNIAIATLLCLSVMLTACGDKTSDTEKVTTTKDAEVESTTDVVDNDATKEPSNTTTIADADTTKQETTTKQPETTTKEQQTTTKKPETTTPKETTTKKPEQETTTKEQETTTGEPESENVTRDNIIAAAMKLADVEDDMNHPFSSVTNARLAFCDVTLDGVPELLILSTQIWGNVDATIYKYENGKYKDYWHAYAVGQGSRLYKDQNGNAMILELVTNLGENEKGEVIFHNKHNIADIASKTRTEIKYAMSSPEVDLSARVYYVTGEEISPTEYLNTIYSQLKEYTLVGEMMELMGIDNSYDLEGLNRAYDGYLAGNK